MKRLIVLGMAFWMWMSLWQPASAQSTNIYRYFPEDVPTDFWAYEEIDLFLSADIISGSMDQNRLVYIKPNEKVTRAEFSKMIVKALGLSIPSEPYMGRRFKDVPETNWAYPFVKTASEYRIVNGFADDTFRPNEYITRAQMASMITNAFDYIKNTKIENVTSFIDLPKGYWATDSIMKAQKLGVVKGFGDVFKPGENSTRAQAIVMLHRALFGDVATAPASQELSDRLRQILDEETKIYNGGDLLLLNRFYNANSLGFHREYGLYLMYKWHEIYYVTFTGTFDYQINPIKISNRFAILEVSGLNYTYTTGGKTTEGNSDGYYFLIKDINGKWKIFNSYTFQ